MGRIDPVSFATRAGEHVVIRCAEKADAAELIEYLLTTLAGGEFFITERDEFCKSEEEERDFIAQHRNESGWLLLVAVCDGEIIGCLNFENVLRRRLAHGGTLGVSLAEPMRGKGIGTRMMETLIEWAEENPLIERLGLGVLASNARAIHVYKKLGFKEEGRGYREVKFAPHRYCDDVRMYLWLGAEDAYS